MTIQRVEVIAGLERRRQFSDEEKLRLVEEAFQPVSLPCGQKNGTGFPWKRIWPSWDDAVTVMA